MKTILSAVIPGLTVTSLALVAGCAADVDERSTEPEATGETRRALILPGAPDTGFSGDGQLTKPLVSGWLPPQAPYGRYGVVVHTDGSIAAGVLHDADGYNQLYYYDAAGMPDTSKGNGGIATVFAENGYDSDSVTQVMIADGNHAYLAGNFSYGTDIWVALVPNGASGPLTGWAGVTSGVGIYNGLVWAQPTAMARASDGSIYVAGATTYDYATYGIFVMKLTAGGKVDTTYGGTRSGPGVPAGYATPVTLLTSHDELPTAIAVEADGKVVVVGTTIDHATGAKEAIIRQLTASGGVDGNFAGAQGGRTVVSATLNGVAIAGDGTIVTAGARPDPTAGDEFQMIRFSATSGLITQRTVVGFSSTPAEEATSIVVASDGKLVLGGYAGSSNARQLALVRLQSDGTPDTSFDGDSKVLMSVVGMAGASVDALQLMNGRVTAVGPAVDSSGHPSMALGRWYY